MSELTITKENFEAEVLQSKEPVLIDFWASWCGPCRMLSPVISEIAEESSGKFKVGKVNVDDQEELAAMFRISSIPTLVVLKDGKVTNSSVGVRSKKQILEMLTVDQIDHNGQNGSADKGRVCDADKGQEAAGRTVYERILGRMLCRGRLKITSRHQKSEQNPGQRELLRQISVFQGKGSEEQNGKHRKSFPNEPASEA